MLAAVNKFYLEDKNPRVVLAKGKVVPLRRAGNVFFIDLWLRGPCQGFCQAGPNSRREGRHPDAR